MSEQVDQVQLLRTVRLALQNQDYPEAIRSLKLAAKLAHDAGDVATEGRHLGNLALIYYRVGKHEQALRYFEHALAAARADDDRVTEDGILGNMGNILRELRRYDDAIDYLNRALLIAQEIGDVRGRGIWLGNLGLVYDDLGKSSEAIVLHEQSVFIARQLHDQRGLAQRLGNLGNSHMAADDFTTALKVFHEAVGIYREIGDKREWALALRLGIIGNIYSELGRRSPSEFEAKMCFDLALDSYKSTLELARELNDTFTEAELLSSLGNVYGNIGDYELAIEHFQGAYQRYSDLGLTDRLEHLQNNIDLALSYRDQTTS
jgi:tetratricopeptide (TPR) repeat protein